ncbi:hypothetical protein ACNSN2_17050 [Pseudoalteromonas sp. US3C1013]|uniref:hypothetical protein n=1 Tax=unclassified Pseudoalteromonas TaxID=194690 RepID=UPI0020BF951D|nr:hypothetical protein [Pseudoalteromonas sp. 2CM39R]MCK8125207.1 hypothetical protein [Pseudoalteromonas sp. 2CM39R]
MNKKESKGSGILYAVFITVLLYFFFKITLTFSIVSGRNFTCLSSIWSNSYTVITPFSAFFIVAIFSCIWFFYCGIKYKQKVGKSVYLLLAVGAVFYYFWFQGFYGFWQLMSYEQKEITLQEFFEKTGGTERLKLYGSGANQNVLCKSQYNKVN